MKKCLSGLVLLGLSLIAADAKVFEVDPGTPDGLAAALASARTWKATAITNEPVIIRLGEGTHLLTRPVALGPEDSGTAKHPLRIEARDPGDTLVSGARRIEGWQAGTDGIWRASVPADFAFEQLYVNGRRAIRARSPDRDFFKVVSMSTPNPTARTGRVTFGLPPEAMTGLPTDAADLKSVNILFLHKWDTTRHYLESADPAAQTVAAEVHGMKPWNPLSKGVRFQLENYRAALTEAGEWFRERDGTVLYLPRPGERISRIEACAPVTEKFLEIRGAAHVRFEGVRFHHAGYRLPSEGNQPAQAASYLEAAIMLDDANEVVFDRCEIAHTGLHGIWYRSGCHGGGLRQCLIEDTGAGAVRIGDLKIASTPAQETGGIVVENCLIRSVGHVHPSACAVWIGQSGGNRIEHCDISDTTYTGISVGWTWGYGKSASSNNFIGNNRIHDIGQGVLSDLGGIYTLGAGRGNRCVGNVFYNCRGHDYGGWGIYHDEGSTGWRSESNLVWNSTCVKPAGGAGFHQHYGRENEVVNNVFAESSGALMQATRVEEHLSFTIERNLLINSQALLFGGVGNPAGPWAKVRFASDRNALYYTGSATNFMAGLTLAGWQAKGHDTNSVLLKQLKISGDWPDVRIKSTPELESVGFIAFDTSGAGLQGERAWRKRATEERAQPRGLIQP